MRHINFGTINTIGLNLLTGEACSFSMRTLCDFNAAGSALLRDFLGLPADCKFNESYNSSVNGQPAVGCIMLTREQFGPLMRFALFQQGCQFVYTHENSDDYSGFSVEDYDKYPGLRAYVEGELPEHARLYRNPRNPAASQGSRNVHQFTGRVV